MLIILKKGVSNPFEPHLPNKCYNDLYLNITLVSFGPKKFVFVHVTCTWVTRLAVSRVTNSALGFLVNTHQTIFHNTL